MTKRTTIVILAASAALLYASPVMAQDAETETAVQPRTEVLNTVETADMIPVQTEDGTVFYNRYVSEDELYTVDYDLDVVDTYTYEYNGRTYTNKVVED